MNTTLAPPTAQNDVVDFAPLAGARHLLLTTTSKAVTPFAGLASFIAWLRQTGFLDQAARALPFSYASPNATPLAHTFTAFLLSVVVGASRFAHRDWLRFDSALHAMLGFKRFPGDDAILRLTHPPPLGGFALQAACGCLHQPLPRGIGSSRASPRAVTTDGQDRQITGQQCAENDRDALALKILKPNAMISRILITTRWLTTTRRPLLESL